MSVYKNMKDVDDWLRRISEHTDNPRWLSQHHDSVYQTLHYACNHGNYRSEAVTLIARIHTWILDLPNVTCWIGLLNEALKVTMDRDMPDQQMEIWKALGLGHLFTGKGVAAEMAFTRLLEKATCKQQRPLMLLALLGISKAQMYTFSEKFTEEHVQLALELAYEFANEHIIAELYQALGFAFTYRGELRRGIEYGQMALLLWIKLKVPKEIAQSAYTLTIAHRMLGRWQLALRWIEFSKLHFSKTDNPRQHVLLTAEQASIYMKMELYETARQWYELTAKEAEDLPPRYRLPQYIAGAHRGMALALIHQSLFAHALPHLWQAIVRWQQIQKTSYELASNFLSIGYVEMQMRHVRMSYRYLDRALRMCRQLPETPRRKQLEDQILKTLDDIQKSGPPV